MDWITRKLPKSVAQLTGVLVCGIVTFGADLELAYAIPLGIMAGALAMFFVSVTEARQSYNQENQ